MITLSLDLLWTIFHPVLYSIQAGVNHGLACTRSCLMIYPDIANPSAIAAAVGWIEQALLGSVATGVATLAVATVGAAMLTGRLNWRRGVSAIGGCFIVFGAPVIAHGLSGLARHEPVRAMRVDAAPAQTAPSAVAIGYDPYAGAALVARPSSKDQMRDRLASPTTVEAVRTDQTGLAAPGRVR